jgi:alanine racemase
MDRLSGTVRPTRALVDTHALSHNLGEVRRLAGPTPILGIVKADAYGHGARLVASVLQRAGIDWLGVALVEEGLELRELGIGLPLLILDGAYGGRYDLLLAYKLTPIVFRRDHLEGLAAAGKRLGRKPEAHLKVDTGMGRLGVLPHEVQAFGRAAHELGVEISGICTHFANADLGDAAMAQKQLARFDEAVRLLREDGHTPRFIHLANSAASIELPEARGTLIRPGLMLYGHLPSPRLAGRVALQPVLTWTTEVIQVKSVEAGFPVSYGGRFVTARPSRLATLAVGYADGYRRDLSGKARVLLHGKYAPIVGVITMDLCVADVTDLPEVSVGDEAVLLGSQGTETIRVEDLASAAGTISYEILCGISARVPRVPTP